MLRVPVPRWLMQEVTQWHKIYPGSDHGAVHPAECASTVLSCTGVLVVGGYKLGERGMEASMSLRMLELIETSANIGVRTSSSERVLREGVRLSSRGSASGRPPWKEAYLLLL
jgi:hypothetical protein